MAWNTVVLQQVWWPFLHAALLGGSLICICTFAKFTEMPHSITIVAPGCLCSLGTIHWMEAENFEQIPEMHLECFQDVHPGSNKDASELLLMSLQSNSAFLRSNNLRNCVPHMYNLYYSFMEVEESICFGFFCFVSKVCLMNVQLKFSDHSCQMFSDWCANTSKLDYCHYHCYLWMWIAVCIQFSCFSSILGSCCTGGSSSKITDASVNFWCF